MDNTRHIERALQAWEGGACNLRALVNALKTFVDDNKDMDSNALNSHPATRLYLSQMAFLAGIGIGETANADLEARKILSLD